MLWLGIGIASCFVVSLGALAVVFRKAPLGFECDRCGFLRGTSEDEEIHRRTHDIVDHFERETAA